jgi:import receptor subunit TOM70
MPPALEEEDLDEESGKGQLRKGFLAMANRTGDGYEDAAAAFERALELGDLDDLEALALNMRATFTYLAGDSDSAMQDLNRSIELDPSLVQSYIKRASLHLEHGQ